jgi:hypothetical protein
MGTLRHPNGWRIRYCSASEIVTCVQELGTGYHVHASKLLGHGSLSRGGCKISNALRWQSQAKMHWITRCTTLGAGMLQPSLGKDTLQTYREQ